MYKFCLWFADRRLGLTLLAGVSLMMDSCKAITITWKSWKSSRSQQHHYHQRKVPLPRSLGSYLPTFSQKEKLLIFSRLWSGWGYGRHFFYQTIKHSAILQVLFIALFIVSLLGLLNAGLAPLPRHQQRVKRQGNLFFIYS